MKNWHEITKNDIYTYLDSNETSVYHKNELAKELSKGSLIYESYTQGYGRFAALETLVNKIKTKSIKLKLMLIFFFCTAAVSSFSMILDLYYNQNAWFSQAFFQTSTFAQGFVVLAFSVYGYKIIRKSQKRNRKNLKEFKTKINSNK